MAIGTFSLKFKTHVLLVDNYVNLSILQLPTTVESAEYEFQGTRERYSQYLALAITLKVKFVIKSACSILALFFLIVATVELDKLYVRQTSLGL